MRWIWLSPVLALVASACQSPITAEDRAKCRDRGLTEGSAPYAACLKEVSEARYAYWRAFSERTDRFTH